MFLCLLQFFLFSFSFSSVFTFQFSIRTFYSDLFNSFLKSVRFNSRFFYVSILIFQFISKICAIQYSFFYVSIIFFQLEHLSILQFKLKILKLRISDLKSAINCNGLVHEKLRVWNSNFSMFKYSSFIYINFSFS